MTVTIEQVSLALNIYGEPYVNEGDSPRWALYADSDSGVVTAATLASGDMPKDHPLYGAEDEWLYGDDVREFLAREDVVADV